MAGGKANTFINDLLKLFFQGTAIANLADNAASAPLTSLYMSLHTGDPGAGGNQTTNEAAYTSYARQPITRNSGGFTVSGQTVTLTSDITFATATGGSETETWGAIGTASSGSGKILWRGPLTSSIAVTTGIQPKISSGTTIITEA